MPISRRDIACTQQVEMDASRDPLYQPVGEYEGKWRLPISAIKLCISKWIEITVPQTSAVFDEERFLVDATRVFDEIFEGRRCWIDLLRSGHLRVYLLNGDDLKGTMHIKMLLVRYHSAASKQEIDDCESMSVCVAGVTREQEVETNQIEYHDQTGQGILSEMCASRNPHIHNASCLQCSAAVGRLCETCAYLTKIRQAEKIIHNKGACPGDEEQMSELDPVVDKLNKYNEIASVATFWILAMLFMLLLVCFIDHGSEMASHEMWTKHSLPTFTYWVTLLGVIFMFGVYCVRAYFLLYASDVYSYAVLVHNRDCRDLPPSIKDE